MKLDKFVTAMRTRAKVFKSGRALADQVGMSNGHLASIERGEQWNLSVDLIARLSAELKVRPEALLLAAMESRDEQAKDPRPGPAS